ncbi:FAD:protein FMN transferase [Micromonospora sp. RHAY321]|uniref:FAD:protein FMN transferase n=1 Tax=Micromonospora sp. RHAY321 TaxID=2944807 RepID=UPI00207C5700|nr:FAD:protein FMN transferase [Micromonospora sp. RHAY321]MCO1593887.1 FAD:protein FMN transferase [Micromonospora sp. RHAY321]
MSTPRRSWVEQIMGMPISVQVRAEAHTPAVASAVAVVFDELRAVDRLFSTYRPDSQVSELNRGRLSIADSDPLVREVLKLCEEARRRTDGYFDAMLPGPEGRLRFDPSGLVKGWAVERAGRLLAEREVTDFSLNAGGDILLRTGSDQPDWRVGVEDPAAPDHLLAALPIRTGAVATSGTGRRGAHILDPYTGRSPVEVASVTVVGPSLTWADVYATAAVARGAGGIRWLADLTGYRALIVDATGALTATAGGMAAERQATLC